MTEPMSGREFLEAAGAEDWRVVSDGACAYFPTPSFAVGARFVQAISELPAVEVHMRMGK